MQRLKDDYLDNIDIIVPLKNKIIFEIGCGDGTRTRQIASRCKKVTAIDPNPEKIAIARTQQARNDEYLVGSATKLPIDNKTFDIVFFTLSLHHIPAHEMTNAIDEALRIVRDDGHIIFFEPAFIGSFFDAEIAFDACDGDERKQKAIAYATMLSHPELHEIKEMYDETIFSFTSVEDFVTVMQPKNLIAESMENFLRSHNFTLRAERRINIFTPKR